MHPQFLPTTPDELQELGWNELDIILVSGDTYIDSSYIGVAVIGRVLSNRGYKVGIIAQPDPTDDKDITRLGQPRLFWGVTGGSVDSMVANYTATKKWRNNDDYTPGGKNNRRPDRAVIAYTNLIKKYFKSQRPIVLGGIEASLRRIAHFDYWSNKIRGSILFDAKADYLVYGMGEKAVCQLADALAGKSKQPLLSIRGLCYRAKEPPVDSLSLPSLAEIRSSSKAFIEMFHTFYINNDPISARCLCQQHGDMFLVQNPPATHLSRSELDALYELPYENAVHPFYRKFGAVRALDTIRFSITSHRGCYGECHFCAIAVHQGRTVLSRSPSSIRREVERLTQHPKFKGIIADVGGPTANMFGFECPKKIQKGACTKRRCLGKKVCQSLPLSHAPHLALLKDIQHIPGVKKVFIASGIRYDLLLADHKTKQSYLKKIIADHISGQMKVAPEHSETKVLDLMGKPDATLLLDFQKEFYAISKQVGKKQFLTYYFIAAYPGCSPAEMKRLKIFCTQKLHAIPEQTQIFTPTPSTYGTLMYATGLDPFSGKSLFVEKDNRKKQAQKDLLLRKKK